jgi:hypothetical protein
MGSLIYSPDTPGRQARGHGQRSGGRTHPAGGLFTGRSEPAERLGVSERTVRRYGAAGLLAGRRAPGALTALIAYIVVYLAQLTRGDHSK